MELNSPDMDRNAPNSIEDWQEKQKQTGIDWNAPKMHRNAPEMDRNAPELTRKHRGSTECAGKGLECTGIGQECPEKAPE